MASTKAPPKKRAAKRPPPTLPPTPVPTIQTPDWKPAFLATLAKTANVSASAEAAGIHRDTAYHARETEGRDGADLVEAQAFANVWDEALEIATDALELEARRRAKDGVERLKFYEGAALIDPRTDEVYIEREYSDGLLKFLLIAHRPETYREQVVHEHSGRIRTVHELSDEELAAIAAGGASRRRAGTA